MAKHSYDDLKKTYQGFVMPGYSITVNKSDTLNKDESIVLSMIEVELTSGYEASACNLVIEDCVDLDTENDTWKVNPKLKNLFKLGYSIDVKLGYLKELKPVFKGIVTSIQLDYDMEEGFQVHVECMDVKRLMMNNFHSCQPRKDLKKYSDAAKEILKKYAKNVEKQVVTDSEECTLAVEQHNQSDYDFLVSIAKKANYAFYIINNEAYFEPLGKDTSPLIELHANNLHGFQQEISLSDQIAEVTVRANDETDPTKSFGHTAKTFKAIGKGKKGSADIATAMKELAKKTIIDPSVGSVKEAKARAEAEMSKHSMKFGHATFKTIGIPDITPGKMMTIKGFGDEFDNDYYIKKVTHQYNQEGFYTKGELGVNKI